MFDPYQKWLGIAPKHQPPTLYRLLGIDPFESDAEVIDAAANRLMAWLQEFSTGEHVAESQKLLNEIAAARVRLLNAETKVKYDQELRQAIRSQADAAGAGTARRPASHERSPASEPAGDLLDLESGLPSGIHRLRTPDRKPATVGKAAAPSKPGKREARTTKSPRSKGGAPAMRGAKGARPTWLRSPVTYAVVGVLAGLLMIGGVLLGRRHDSPRSEGAGVEKPAEKAKSERATATPVPVPTPTLSRRAEIGVFTGKSIVASKPPAQPDDRSAPTAVDAGVEARKRAYIAKRESAAHAADSDIPARLQRDAAVPESPAARVSTSAGSPLPSTSAPASVPVSAAASLESKQPGPAGKPKISADDHRLPVPPAEAQQRAKTMLDELFAGRVKKGREAQQQYVAALFKKEPQMAAEPVSLYVLLCEARDSSAQIPDLALANQAVDALIARFQVGALEARTELLDKLQANKTLPAEECSRSADQSLSLAEEAIRAAAFAQAEQLLRLAVPFASRAREGELRKEASAKLKQLPKLIERFEEADRARDRIAKNDNDTSAHETLGRYLCFVDDDWESGLAHLAKSSDASLKAVAAQSLGEMNDPSKLLELGDAWRKTASQRGLPRDLRQQCVLTAVHWYARAKPWLIGLPRATCEKRLAENASAAKSATVRRPPLPAVAPLDATAAAEHRQRWARYLNAMPVGTNSIGMKLALVCPGEFQMGLDDAAIAPLVKAAGDKGGRDTAESAGPRHRVRITRPFYVGCYEVTVGQFRTFVNDAKYKTTAETDKLGGFVYSGAGVVRKPEINWQNAGYEQSDNHPVVNVSHFDAAAFCEWLSRREDSTYRLPTEAEWEYVCRAGTDTLYPFGNDPKSLLEFVRLGERTSPVGGKPPNAFGVYDMLGSVHEWVNDWFSYDYYRTSPHDHPPGPISAAGDLRVIRDATANHVCGARSGAPDKSCHALRGFRVVRLDQPH